ncbi:hypothetical protein SLEP1_g59278, partial [Rubroshorea leprosula]
MKIEEEDSLKNHYNLIQQYKSLKKEVRDIVTSPKYCIPHMKYGRVSCIQCTDEGKSPSFSIEDPITWGILLDFHRVKSNHDDDASIRPENANYALNVLTRCVVSKDGVSKKTIKILSLKEHGEPLIVSIPLSQSEDDNGKGSDEDELQQHKQQELEPFVLVGVDDKEGEEEELNEGTGAVDGPDEGAVCLYPGHPIQDPDQAVDYEELNEGASAVDGPDEGAVQLYPGHPIQDPDQAVD